MPRDMIGTSEAVLAKSDFNPLYVSLPEDYLPPHELWQIIVRRPDVPAHMRCVACMLLLQRPRWWPCCDVFVCEACLGPPECTWACPACSRPHNDQNEVREIGLVTALVWTWAHAALTTTEKYSRMASMRSCDSTGKPVSGSSKT